MALVELFWGGSAVRDTTGLLVKTTADLTSMNFAFPGTGLSQGAQVVAAFLASTPRTVPVVVQVKTALGVTALSFNSNVVSGNLMVVFVGNEHASVAGATVSDSIGSTWLSAITTLSAVSCSIKMFYALAASSGANTITFGGYTATRSNIGIVEISGAQASLDGTPTGAGDGATSPGVLITTVSNSIAVAGLDANTNTSTWNPSSGCTLTQTNGAHAVGIATAVVSLGRGGTGIIGRYRVLGIVDSDGSGGGAILAPNWGELGNLPEGVLTVPYEYDWDMQLSASPVAYSVTSGSLPAGITLSALGPTGGRLTGTPTIAGTFTFTILASSAYGTDSQSFSLVVVAVSGGGYSYAFAA